MAMGKTKSALGRVHDDRRGLLLMLAVAGPFVAINQMRKPSGTGGDSMWLT